MTTFGQMPDIFVKSGRFSVEFRGDAPLQKKEKKLLTTALFFGLISPLVIKGRPLSLEGILLVKNEGKLS
jgi:hypothetical protein